MPDLTSLANWSQIISLPLTLWLTIYLYLRSKPNRSLACELNKFPIEIKGGQELDGKIEIYYQNQKVKNLFIVRAKIINQGNRSIRHNRDVLSPITFTFQPDVRFLGEPRIIEQPSGNRNINGKTGRNSSAHEAYLNFDILNVREAISLEFVCTGTSKDPNITVVIDEMPELVIVDTVRRDLRQNVITSSLKMAFAWLGGIVVIGPMIFFYKALLAGLQSSDIWFKFVSIVEVILILLWFLWIIINIRRSVYSILEYRKYCKQKTGRP